MTLRIEPLKRLRLTTAVTVEDITTRLRLIESEAITVAKLRTLACPECLSKIAFLLLCSDNDYPFYCHRYCYLTKQTEIYVDMPSAYGVTAVLTYAAPPPSLTKDDYPQASALMPILDRGRLGMLTRMCGVDAPGEIWETQPLFDAVRSAVDNLLADWATTRKESASG